VQTYYGSQAERGALRDSLKRQFRRGKLEVVLASYTQVVSAEDLHFFRKKIDFEVGLIGGMGSTDARRVSMMRVTS